jgi:PAS domain S-box-containing protein
VAGCLVLAGWALDLTALKSILPGLASMKANTALGFILSGTSLLLLQGEPDLARTRLSRACAAIATLAGLLTLGEYLFHLDLGIDQWLFRDMTPASGAYFPGRMSLATAFSFLTLGCALLLASARRFDRLGEALTLAGLAVSLVALLGYCYGISSLYRIGAYSSMALHTALTFALLNFGTLSVRPERGLMRLISSRGVGGATARRLLPAAIGIPFVLGWLGLTGERMGFYDTAISVTLLVLSNIIFFTILILWNAALLSREGIERSEAEARFRLAVESAPNAVLMVDPQGQMVLVNSQTEKLFGYRREELIGRKVEKLVPARFRGGHEQFRSDFFTELEARPMGAGRELYGLRKDGSEFPIEIGLNPIRTDEGVLVLSAIVDISERKRSEDVQAQLAAIVASSDVAIIGKRLDGVIVNWNAGAEKLYGYSAEEAVGQPISFIAPPDRQDEIMNLLAQLKEGESIQSLETTRVTKDGRPISVSLNLSPIMDKYGKIVGAATIANDITARKQSEERLRRQAEELRHSNEELEQFAYVASHDLQEPLRMVSSYVQLLARRYQGRLDSDADEFIGFAVEGANRMKVLINDLLAFSRVGTRSKEFGPVPLDKIFDEVVRNLELAVEESSAVISRDSLPRVLADEVQMAQLFQNLIGNAIKFRGEAPPRVHVGARSQDDHWLLFVRDNGIGLDPKFAERIFVIFQRLHNRAEYPGTGIGLAICRKIVERHGGRIWVESQPGAGATFLFTLPPAGEIEAPEDEVLPAEPSKARPRDSVAERADDLI